MENSQNNNKSNQSNKTIKIVLIVIVILVGLILISGIIIVVGLLIAIVFGTTSYKTNTVSKISDTKIFKCESDRGTLTIEYNDDKLLSEETTGNVLAWDIDMGNLSVKYSGIDSYLESRAESFVEIYKGSCTKNGVEVVIEDEKEVTEDTKKDTDEDKDTSKDTTPKEITGNVTTSDGLNYTLDTEIKDVNNGDTITYKINNDYTIKAVVTDTTSYWGPSLDIYVNNKKMEGQPIYLWRFGVNAGIVGDYLVFDSNTATDIRSITTYVFSKDGSLVKEIYELEDIKGMVPSEHSKVEAGKLVIKGRRSFHGFEVIYGDDYKNNHYSLCDALSKLGPDFPILQDYVYEIKNGVLDLDNPTKTVTETLKEYYDAAKEYGNNCE